MNSSGVGTASSPILIDDDSDTEVEAQVLPVPHPQPQPQLEVSSVPTRPRGPTTPRAPRAIREKDKITSDTVGFQMLMRMGYEPAATSSWFQQARTGWRTEEDLAGEAHVCARA
ncbi:hypothetical protein PENSPDRAFT_106698 [Peniophora sp. CONT]|nr:hypothetical protein PENSPDRAFT_106698 [Peniophora sp. CONT]